MIISEQQFQLGNYTLHRSIFDPQPDVPTTMACFFCHGQGDFSLRYSKVLHLFTQRGIRCILVDLPGHGLSSGKRGDISGSEFIDQIIESNFELAEGLDYGIAGHSMGGLLTLRHLLLSLEGRLPMPKFCWVNSPLLHPAQNKSNTFVALGKFISKIFPKLIINTGTKPELCRTNPAPDTPLSQLETKEQKEQRIPLSHQKISLRWATEIIHIAENFQQSLPQYNAPLPFLFTQGGSDVICPEFIASDFFQSLNLPNKSYKSYPDMRHETFVEPQKQLMFDDISEWLTKCNITSTKP